MNAIINKSKMKKFEQIAREHLIVDTLQERKSDRLDFHTCSVWRIAQALNAAFELGQKSAKKSI